MPLLDVEETIVAKVLSALTSLCELGLFQKMKTYDADVGYTQKAHKGQGRKVGGRNNNKKETSKQLHKAQQNHKLNPFPLFIIKQLWARLSLAVYSEILNGGEVNRNSRFILFLLLVKELTVPLQRKSLRPPQNGAEDQGILLL